MWTINCCLDTIWTQVPQKCWEQTNLAGRWFYSPNVLQTSAIVLKLAYQTATTKEKELFVHVGPIFFCSFWCCRPLVIITCINVLCKVHLGKKKDMQGSIDLRTSRFKNQTCVMKESKQLFFVAHGFSLLFKTKLYISYPEDNKNRHLPADMYFDLRHLPPELTMYQFPKYTKGCN